MRLHERELRNQHHDHRWTDKTRDSLRVRHGTPRLPGSPNSRGHSGGFNRVYDPPVSRDRSYWIARIATIRVFAFLSGWVLTVHYGDWRQLVGYPLILIGALPDALFVRYIIRPQSPAWPFV